MNDRVIGPPEGRDEYTERIKRTIYRDGTHVDSSPVRFDGRKTAFSVLAAVVSPKSDGNPAGTRVVWLERRVTVETTPWAEVVPDEVTLS